jgi:hypothetical protein
MAMKWSRRSVIGAALAAAVPAAGVMATAEEKSAPAAKGKLTDESLGTLLKAMGFDAKLEEKRYDFEFKATIENEEWTLSFSSVLSQDASSVWIMAWLDELPKSAADVPRTALLRLLADNDKLGKGKFFTYIATNRRFVLQRVIPNEGITSEKFRAVLDDLGQSVVATHPHWSVANWNAPSGDEGVQPASQTKTNAPSPSGLAVKSQAKAEKTAVNDSKFGSTSKK